ncbi:MAG: DUF3598 family protein [Leptolyngbyaceae cyanobacterium MO_188.B28]|nr:DUF3598 family protein [Leptolyngbyaceae cyanobacterium MO_188.B28]
MNKQEQHWLNLFGDYTSEGTAWHANVTVYTPDQHVLRAYQFTRTFATNHDKTIVTHRNEYFLHDGATKEQTWRLDKQTCNQPDGVIHPASTNMRSLSMGQGSSAWVPTQVVPNQAFSTELFLRKDSHRYSVVIIYTLEGQIERIVTITEQVNEFPPPATGEKLEKLSGQWREKVETMTPSLEVIMHDKGAIWKDLPLDSSQTGNKTFLLPDNFVVNIPEALAISQGGEGDTSEFYFPALSEQQTCRLTVGKRMHETEYKQLSLEYNHSGDLQRLECQTFERVS